MTLEKPVSEWEFGDIKHLVSSEISESMILDYKRQLDLGTQPQRVEAAKDCSAFANSQGGVIAYGVDERRVDKTTVVPMGLSPLHEEGLEKRLCDVLLNSVSPPMSFMTKSINNEEGPGYFLVVEIPQSVTGVHMVVSGGDCRFYKRHNLSADPMHESEVQRAYQRVLTTLSEESSRYERDRSPIADDLLAVQMVAVPVAFDDRLIDLKKYQPDDLVPAHILPRTELINLPLKRVPGGYETAIEQGGDLPPKIVLVILANGHVEMVWPVLKVTSEMRERILGIERKLVAGSLFQQLMEFLPYAARLYARVGYRGPVRIHYRIAAAQGSRLVTPSGFAVPPQPFRDREWEASYEVYAPILINEYVSFSQRILDDLWIAYGYDRCYAFSEDGKPIYPLP